MKDTELKSENVDAPHTLGGGSDTTRYINLTEEARPLFL